MVLVAATVALSVSASKRAARPEDGRRRAALRLESRWGAAPATAARAGHRVEWTGCKYSYLYNL